MWEDNKGWTFSLEKMLLWIMDFLVLELNILMDFVYTQFFILQDDI